MNTDAPEVRRRLRKQLAQLVTWLETGGEQPVLFGSCDEYEWLLRVTGVVASLLVRHQVDGRGSRARRAGEPPSPVAGGVAAG